MIAPVLVQPPAANLIDLRLVKEQLRVDDPAEDFLIGHLVAAALAHLDGWSGVLGRCIGAQTWRSFGVALTDMALPFPDVQSAVVKYLDAGGTEQVLSPAAYRIGNDSGGGYLTFEPDASLPAVADREDAVRVDAVYGYAALPAPILAAVLMMVAHWYDNRDGGQDMPAAATALIAPFRMLRL